MMILDHQKVDWLLLLDFTAAFDNIDHEIVLIRMKKRCGTAGFALKWFSSHHTGRNSLVRVRQNNSTRETT